jgi:dihydropteroate synthase
MESNTQRIWKHRTGEFQLGVRTLIMGVLNVTPDSFSDGGKYLDVEHAVERAMALQQAGADILDIGAESTRPGSLPVPESVQLDRLLPVLNRTSGAVSIPVSVDTTSSIVAAECIDAGASIINDISGFHRDFELPKVCAKHFCGAVLMHIRGTPENMQRNPDYFDLLEDIYAYLREGCETASQAGMSDNQLVVDPGIGFGKNFDQNHQLLGNLAYFRSLAAGVLVGTSRKAFTGEFNKLPADQRQFSTAATIAIAVLHGADIVRVHDVHEMKQVTDICDRFREINSGESS